MTRAFTTLPKRATVDLPDNGGLVRSSSDRLWAPEMLLCTPTGVAFGPLHIGTPGLVTIDRLTFLPSDDDGGVISVLGTGALAAAAPRDGEEPDVDVEDVAPQWMDGDDRRSSLEPSSTRRGLMTALAAIAIAATYGSTQVSAQDSGDEEVVLNFAEFRISKIDAPVAVSVFDRIQEVLPPTAEMLIDQENTRVGKLVEPGEDVELLQQTGTVKVYLKGSRSDLAQLIAWIRSLFPRDKSLTYRRTLPEDKMASDFEEGTVLFLTSHPAIVDPIKNLSSDETILEIGNTTIPHSDDGSDEAGVWSIFDDSLIYEVGSNPPAAKIWQVTTRLQAWQTILQ